MYLCPHSEDSPAEETHTRTDLEPRSLTSNERTLYNTRMTLLAAGNTSTSLTPVNKLPPEILTRIFSRLDKCLIHVGKPSLHNIGRVCRYWRQIAMNAADLWTHVDIEPNTSESLTRMLLERARNRPVYVHLHEPRVQTRSLPKDLSTATGILIPLLDRIQVLDIESYSVSRKFVSPVLNLWLGSGKPNLARHLLVYRPYASVVLSPEVSSRGLGLLSGSDNARGVMKSLKRLHLQNVKFDWDSGAYRGLVDLRLHCFCSSTSISIAQLVKILSSNPTLIILKLSCLEITSSSDWSPTPVTLSCLEVLALFYIDPGGLQLLLPLLVLPGSSVKVGIGPTDLDSISSELERFFGRNSHVTALKLRQWKRSAFLTWLPFLRVLPRLDNLVLDSFHMDAGPDVGCTITLDGLKMLIVEHGTSQLRLESCVVSDGSGINMEDIQTSLLGTYPELQVVISNTSSAEHSEYCRMFNWTN